MPAPKTTEKEYGRRLYVSPLAYQSQIRKPTDKALDDLYKLPHSENKKPYREDSYEEMEYFLSPPFGFSWDWPEFDLPFVGFIDPWVPPWFLVFTCQVETGGCFCAGQKRCYALNCSHKVVSIEVNELLTPVPGHFSISYNSGQICITATEEAETVVYFDVTMVADPGDGSEVFGTHEGLSVTSCSDEDCGCISPPSFSYDDASSADVVYRTGSANVYVDGGQAPFTWSITGTGLTMANAETDTGENQVNASASACGPGAITVTDACDQVVYGFIRVVEGSTWGAWGDYDSVFFQPCEPGGDWNNNSGNNTCDDPIFQYYARWGGEFYSGDCPQSCLCENYHIVATTGPPDNTRWGMAGSDHGCEHTCTYQAGARAMRNCRIRVREWECT